MPWFVVVVRTPTQVDHHSYLSRNPVYHQVVFGLLMFTNAFRTLQLLRYSDLAQRMSPAARKSIGRTFIVGAGTFAFGFLVWNLDNIFCSSITSWKKSLGWPAAFILEGEDTPLIERHNLLNLS